MCGLWSVRRSVTGPSRLGATTAITSATIPSYELNTVGKRGFAQDFDNPASPCAPPYDHENPPQLINDSNNTSNSNNCLLLTVTSISNNSNSISNRALCPPYDHESPQQP